MFLVSKLAFYKVGGSVQLPPFPIEIEGELGYEVEKVLNRRVFRRGQQQKTNALSARKVAVMSIIVGSQ